TTKAPTGSNSASATPTPAPAARTTDGLSRPTATPPGPAPPSPAPRPGPATTPRRRPREFADLRHGGLKRRPTGRPPRRPSSSSERQDVALAAVCHGADVGAQTQAHAGADRGQHDAVGALVVHAQAAHQIGRALHAGVAAIDHVGVV